MDADLQKKLSDLDKGQVEILRRFDEMADTIKDTVVEIGGVPDEWGRDPHRKSIRRRLHELENDREAVRIASEAVQVASDMQKQQTAREETAAMNAFSRREKLVGLALAALMAVSPYIAAVVFH